jgi:hypothetical protein
MRRMLVVAAGLVATVGVSLFLLTEQTDVYFAWTIASPMTAAFLGAAYWSSAVLELWAARERAWANARVAVPAVLLFTVLMLVVTLVHAERFHFDAPLLITRLGTWFWLAVYAGVPVILGFFFVLQLQLPHVDPPRHMPLPLWARGIFIVQSAVLFVLGLPLLLVPAAAAPFWPWPLTPLAGRAVGAWLLALSVAGAHVVWENDRRRVRSAAASYLALALLQLVALARYGAELRWAEPNAWLYLAYLLVMLAFGVYLNLPQRERQRAVPA